MDFEIKTADGFAQQDFAEFEDSLDFACGPKSYSIEGEGANDWITLSNR